MRECPRILFIFCVILKNINYSASELSTRKDFQDQQDIGHALILTEFIENGSIVEARRAARVHYDAFQQETTYSGFFTVNKTYDKNLFVWFCPSISDYRNDPVVLWLQGGPGGSSLFGLFTENGPFKLLRNGTIIMNEYSWSKTHSVLYIDNPAGTGYSFTTDQGLNTEEEQIGEELYEAIQQFFLLFPELRRNNFFITGESYAGKYVPVVSDTILLKNSKVSDSFRIHLKGLAIGNGFTDPINQLDLGEYAFQHGLVDFNTKTAMDDHKKKITNFIIQEKFAEATVENHRLIGTFTEASGFSNLYNYLYPLLEDDENLVSTFVQKPEVRKAIHVGNLTFHKYEAVSRALHEDIMKSVVNLLPKLLDNYRILFYNGQLDIRLPYPCMVNYLRKLNFSAADEYKSSKRAIWYMHGDIAGYAKNAGNLTELLVRNAGHLVPTDQPEWAFDMINRFTRNRTFE